MQVSYQTLADDQGPDGPRDQPGSSFPGVRSEAMLLINTEELSALQNHPFIILYINQILYNE